MHYGGEKNIVVFKPYKGESPKKKKNPSNGETRYVEPGACTSYMTSDLYALG